jgi:hypothetical protein
MVVTFGVLILEHNFGPFPSSLMWIWRGVMIAMIMVPAVVLSGYVACVFGIAFVALVKVVRTNWRARV